MVSGEAGDSFLGTQGYIWDTQSDMLYATIGAICMMVFVSGIQDRQIEMVERVGNKLSVKTTTVGEP